MSFLIQVWDTAGQERYQSLGIAFYKGAECCLLVYDITNPRSFTSLENWKREFLRQSAPRNPETFPFIVLGNKSDKESERKIQIEKVTKWCEDNGNMPFFETSAKEHKNVTNAFDQAAKMALNNQLFNQPLIYQTQGSNKLTVKKTKQKGCC